MAEIWTGNKHSVAVQSGFGGLQTRSIANHPLSQEGTIHMRMQGRFLAVFLTIALLLTAASAAEPSFPCEVELPEGDGAITMVSAAHEMFVTRSEPRPMENVGV